MSWVSAEQRCELESLAPHVSKEIAKIYEERCDSTAHISLNLVNSHTSNAKSTTQNLNDVIIPRAYVRPTRAVVADPSLSHIRPRTATETLKELVSSPLPLMRFNAVSEKEVVSARTITGEKIRFIPNQLGRSTFKKAEPLNDPMYSRRIAKWFIKRSFKESNWRQVESYSSHFGAAATTGAAEEKPDLLDIVVYESLLYAEPATERTARNEARISERQIFQERFDRLCAPADPPQDCGNALLPAINSSSSLRDANGQSKGPTLASIPCYTPSLIFDGEFESGNIEKVVRVIGRESLVSARALEHVQDYAVPANVDQEYDITLRKDVNTDGNIQWYYFSASIPPPATTTPAASGSVPGPNAGADGGVFSARSVDSSSSSHSGARKRSFSAPVAPNATSSATTGNHTPNQTGTGMVPISFPLRVRFNIINMQKKDSLYNYGMKPATYSENQLQQEDWVHSGEDICYYRNGITSVKPASSSSSSRGRGEAAKKKMMMLRYQYTLTFTYTFERPDTVYFAHTFPYTYSDLQLSLCEMERKYRNSGFFHQRTLCETLAGNSCNVLSISERSAGMVESKNKPAIVLTGRVHPGESNSSFILQGFLDFITSSSPEAVKLRKSFVFHVIPMLNPDGVIHGNYRCSLAATDLNRRYGAPHPRLHPTILAKKTFLKNTAQNRTILLYLDLHGHSKLKNAFVYGCDITQQSERITKYLIPTMSPEDVAQRRIFSRIFPKILSTVSNAGEKGGYFSYKDCSFAVDKSKHGTGRVVCWRELNISASYTVEVSFCGNGDNREGKLFKRATEPGSSGYGNQNKLAVPVSSSSSSGKMVRKSASSAQLADNDPGGGSGSGIAYNTPDDTSIPPDSGDVSDGSVDEVIAPAVESKKATTSKKVKKAGSSKLMMRRCSTTPNLSAKNQSTGAATTMSEEESFHSLLSRYGDFVHYRKEDLLNMGRDIGIAIFHFANLSHSSVEEELKIATQADAEEKAKSRRLNLMLGYSGAPPRSAGNGKMPSSGLSTKGKRQNSKGGGTGKWDREDKKTTAASSHEGHLQSAAAWGAGEPDSGEGTENEGDSLPPQQDAIESDFDLDGLDSVLQSLDDAADKQGTEEETTARGAAEAGQNNAGAAAGIAAEDVDFDEGESDGDDNGSDAESDDVKGSSANPSDLALLMREYAQSKVSVMEVDMMHRSLLKAGVFSAGALESAMQAHPHEFLTDHSSQHIGMRMKCEYRIRKGLRCAGDITLTDQVLKQHDAASSGQVEEECASSDGSESNPSVDNVPANRMLKSMKKFKDTKSMVIALRKAAVRKKKKEMELERKLKKKESKKMAKQVSETKKAMEEAVAQAAKEAREAAQQAAVAAAALAAAESPDLGKERAGPRRKNSIFQSAPKHAPLYRLAVDDTVIVQQSLPMKLVNFKAYDAPTEHHQPVYHAHQTAPSSADPVARHPRLLKVNNETSHESSGAPSGGVSPHPVALSMSSLSSAVSKLHFNFPDSPTSNAAKHTTSQSCSIPALQTRRNSLHNSFINPALLPGSLQLETEFGTSGVSGQPNSPKSAVRPTVHSMSSLLGAGVNSSNDNSNARDRDIYTPIPEKASASMSSGRVRPKSGSATSAKRRGY